MDMITKLSNIACVIQCGGVWFANGKFGVTWRLVQAVVKPQESFKGKCHLFLTESEKEKMVGSNQVETQDNISDDVEEENDEVVSDGEKEDDVVEEDDAEDDSGEGDDQEEEETEPEPVVVEEPPKKKKVVRKKKA
jgi:nucleosome binding factor SPN SPT16 subunit